MGSEEKIRQLQEEISLLQKKAKEKQAEAEKNKQVIEIMGRTVDLLQSYIPERKNWREAYRWRYN